MGKSGAVWGIDIGECALKALRCRAGDSPGFITADAFDYIEYPKILSQPEANRAELVRDALVTFLSRNSVRSDRVAISVSGQSGLARFIKLPPVESKKIPDIVHYEAKQQIPFALEDVVWDYQKMAGGSEQEGFAMETEVGLFAMKRDQANRALKPFEEAGIEVDLIQLSPLAIYNFAVFDQMPELPPPDQYDPENPPESTVLISVGTDTTDLVITNGYRVWQRSVPIGGSHFTKALTKELRLTFAKAEHLKRNATAADDPKAVFQAMRPVFNDMLTEIQRSIGFFTSIDRTATIKHVVPLGNAMKLPGLLKYLSQHLGYPVEEIEAYRGLSGGTVVGSPSFRENLLSFAVCYGLSLQGLGLAKLSTNLLPRQIVTDRLVRAKKPWALATAATVLLGCSVGYFGQWRAWASVHEDRFKNEFSAADAFKTQSQEFKTKFEANDLKFKNIDKVGKAIVGHGERRVVFAELLKAIDQSLPRETSKDPKLDPRHRKEVHIDAIEFAYYENRQDWYLGVAKLIDEQSGVVASSQPATTPAPAPADGEATPAPSGDGESAAPADAAPPVKGPQGPGWIVQIRAHHFHNDLNHGSQGAEFVKETLIENLLNGNVELDEGSVPIKELGVAYPVLIDPELPKDVVYTFDSGKRKPEGAAQADVPKNTLTLRRFDFVLQLSWQETPPLARLANREAAKKAKAVAESETASTESASTESATAAASTEPPAAAAPPANEE